MNGLKRTVAVLTLLVTLSGCSAWAQREYVQVRELSANYTEMYVEYTFYDTKGRNLGLGGSANPFSKNGQGGGACCAFLPGPGQTVRVEWDEETPGRSESRTFHYSRDVVVIGSPPLPGDSYNYVITRFFPAHQIEVEFVSESKGGGRSPRLDQIFYGRSVMRHMGE
ncbi:DUF3304 domain-containing protein [Paraburkholderia pallida]|uniref:DUF3304 domain-containing protein n=1 Tax=Paraburkholderia pallida TaxID=2547399 RepID=A0A4V1AZ11_9BURK|nr:DUF3304 domain-containing protein [Paraburkholderia pallida]